MMVACTIRERVVSFGITDGRRLYLPVEQVITDWTGTAGGWRVSLKVLQKPTG